MYFARDHHAEPILTHWPANRTLTPLKGAGRPSRRVRSRVRYAGRARQARRVGEGWVERLADRQPPAVRHRRVGRRAFSILEHTFL